MCIFKDESSDISMKSPPLSPASAGSRGAHSNSNDVSMADAPAPDGRPANFLIERLTALTASITVESVQSRLKT